VFRRTSPALFLVLAFLGFGLVTAAHSARASNAAEAPRKQRLISLIEDRRSQMTDLDKAVRDLRSQVAHAESTRSSRSRAADTSRSDQLVAAQAGASAVTGPGLQVRLSDSATVPVDAHDPSAYRISDSDLQLVVNALWAAGAEAIALNGNRLVATTSIRAAGETIVVNFRPLSPPYRVDAIGADGRKFGASDIAGRMRRWHTSFGLGFSTSHVSKLTVAPYAGRVGIDAATPVGAS
jgi:uncharacterized protein YlxW (UPF0749 family)